MGSEADSLEIDTTLTSEYLFGLRSFIKCPAEVEFRLPTHGERFYDPSQGYFCVYLAYFTVGVPLPPPELLIEIC